MRIIVATLFLALLVACQGFGKVVLNAAQTTSSIATLKMDYVAVRDSVKRHKALFSESEWQTLAEGNELVINASRRIGQLKQGSDATDFLLETNDLIQIAVPLRGAVENMISVMDYHLADMDPGAQVDYMQATRGWLVVDGYVDRMLEEKDTRVKAQMVRDVLRVAASIVGVVRIALV